MSALALDDEQRSYVRRVREVAVDLLPFVEKGTEGRVNRPLLVEIPAQHLRRHELLNRKRAIGIWASWRGARGLQQRR